MRQVVSFIKGIVGVLRYLTRRVKYGVTQIPEETYHTKVCVLANGPSLNEELKNLDYTNSDCFVVNFFASTDYYEKVKPIGYFLLDTRFWSQTTVVDKVKNLYEQMEKKTTWPMKLYVPKVYVNQINEFHHFNNQNITVVPYNTSLFYSGFKKYEYSFYRKQKAIIPIQNIPLFAIYIALVRGYKHIELYGVDYTFFEGMVIDDDNELCYALRHFYSNETPQLRKYIDVGSGKVVKLGDEIVSVGNIYQQHYMMEKLAQSMDATVVNCTKKSMLDCYIRKSQYDKLNTVNQ